MAEQSNSKNDKDDNTATNPKNDSHLQTNETDDQTLEDAKKWNRVMVKCYGITAALFIFSSVIYYFQGETSSGVMFTGVAITFFILMVALKSNINEDRSDRITKRANNRSH